MRGNVDSVLKRWQGGTHLSRTQFCLLSRLEEKLQTNTQIQNNLQHMVSTFDKRQLFLVSWSLLSQFDGLHRLKFPKRGNSRQFIALLTSPRPSLLPKLLDPCTIYCPIQIFPYHSFDKEDLSLKEINSVHEKLAPSCRLGFHLVNPGSKVTFEETSALS